MKNRCARTVDTVERERERESYTLENKGLLSEPKKYKINKDSDDILYFK